MSIRIMSAVWSSKLYSSGKLLVLLAMSDYANDEDCTCRPSVASLAKKSRLSERQVHRILRDMEADGVITTVGEYPSRRGSPISIYQINVGSLEKGDISSTERVTSETEKGDILSPFDTERVTSETEKGDICDTERVTPMSYDPSLEPPIDPLDDEDHARDPEPSSSSSAAQPVLVIVGQLPEQNTSSVSSQAAIAYQTVRKCYEQNFGLLTPILSDRITEAIRTYPAEWIPVAMERAVAAEKRRWDYVEGILRNWSVEGFSNGSRKNSTASSTGRGAKPNSRPTWANYQPAEFDAAFAAELNSGKSRSS